MVVTGPRDVGLAGTVGVDAADRLGSGCDDAGVAVEVDCDGGVGDVDGEDAAGVGAAEGDAGRGRGFPEP